MSEPIDRAKEHERQIVQAMGTCTHFTGLRHDACKAGVNYRTLVGGPDFGWATRLPCGRFMSKEAAQAVPCDRMQLPSREEAEAEVKAADAAYRRIRVCLGAIYEKHGKTRGLVGEMPCPVGCGGTLRYSIAAYNGHVHGRCSTPDCASWMQ